MYKTKCRLLWRDSFWNQCLKFVLTWGGLLLAVSFPCLESSLDEAENTGRAALSGDTEKQYDWNFQQCFMCLLSSEFAHVKVKVKSLSRVRLFATPWTLAYQAPPSMGFSRQEYWSGLPFPSPGDLPNPGIKPRSLTLQADALPSEPQEFAHRSTKTFSSVTQSCPTLCDPMNHSMPGLPVHRQLPEFTQTHDIESVMPSNHLILCRPLLLPPSVLLSIRVFSNESVLHIRWPKHWSFSFSISPSSE